jgi:hypothetical protein
VPRLGDPDQFGPQDPEFHSRQPETRHRLAKLPGPLDEYLMSRRSHGEDIREGSSESLEDDVRASLIPSAVVDVHHKLRGEASNDAPLSFERRARGSGSATTESDKDLAVEIVVSCSQDALGPGPNDLVKDAIAQLPGRLGCLGARAHPLDGPSQISPQATRRMRVLLTSDLPPGLVTGCSSTYVPATPMSETGWVPDRRKPGSCRGRSGLRGAGCRRSQSR